jgi:hypothetical protein
MDALVPPTKVSCGFRQGKKKRKKGAHIGYIDKKPRQRMKNKKASSPPPEEESTPAVERPVVNEPLLPVEPAVEPAVLAPAIQPCALFVSPPALSVSPPGEDDDPLSDESIAKMSPKEFAAFLASQMTAVHNEEHIKATMTHLNSIFRTGNNQPIRSTVVTPSFAATIAPSISIDWLFIPIQLRDHQSSPKMQPSKSIDPSEY